MILAIYQIEKDSSGCFCNFVMNLSFKTEKKTSVDFAFSMFYNVNWFQLKIILLWFQLTLIIMLDLVNAEKKS